MSMRRGYAALLLVLFMAALASGCTSSRPAEDDYTQEDDADWSVPPETVSSGDPACVALGCPPGTNFVGSVNSDKYHFCDCYWAGQIHRENLVCFTDVDEARSAGYVPCKVCEP